jgi:hypothetical protein
MGQREKEERGVRGSKKGRGRRGGEGSGGVGVKGGPERILFAENSTWIKARVYFYRRCFSHSAVTLVTVNYVPLGKGDSSFPHLLPCFLKFRRKPSLLLLFLYTSLFSFLSSHTAKFILVCFFR